MKIKEIIILILIIAAGSFSYYAHTGKFGFTIDFGEGFFWNLEEFTFEEFQEVKLSFPVPSQLQIINSHGEIEIQGTEEEKITITFQKKIWRKDEEQAREVSENLKMIVNEDEDLVKITTNRSEFKKKNFHTNFRISIPQGMDIEVDNSYGLVKASKVGKTKIKNRHGEIILSEVGGELYVENSYEDIDLENVQSDCQIESKHSTVFVKNVKGGTKINHRNGKIYLENISQKVDIESPHTEIYGYGLKAEVEVENSYEKITLHDVGATTITGHHSEVEVDGVQGDLKITNNHTKANLNNIEGNIDIKGKSLAISGRKIVGEQISISSSYKNIELTEFSAKTSILNNHGDTILDPVFISHPIQVKSEYGAIKFFWPKGKKHPFEARAISGEVKWNLPAEISRWEEGRTSIVKAFLQEKDKPSVFLSTSYGDIVVKE